MPSSLPDELWRTILELGVKRQCLTYIDLCCLSMCSRRLQRLSAEPSLWYSLLSSDFPSQTWNPSSSSAPKSLYRERKITMFAIGKDVEVKGFGKWVDTTLLGKIAGYWNDELYIVQLLGVGVDEEREYGARRRDDGYYFRKPVEWQIVHPHFVRDVDPEQSGREYNIGDIVDVDESELWTKLPAMLDNRRKGVIIAKTLPSFLSSTAPFFIDAGEPWIYTIKLETSGEIEEDVLNFRMHPHRVWN